jgi:hypothetical protein
MTTDSGTYKFELDFVEKKELPEAPLIISGPLEELENLYLLLMLGIDSAIKNDSPKVKESGIRWMDKVRQQIKDQEFENLNQNA